MSKGLLTNAIVDSPIADMSLSAWKTYNRGELNSIELDLCMAEVTMLMLDEFKYQPTPSMPTMLFEYNNHIKTKMYADKTKEQQERIRKHVFSDRHVDKYTKDKTRIDGDNMSNSLWLGKMLDKWREIEDKNRFVKVWAIYKDYPSDLVNLKKWGVARDNIVDQAKNIFGGEVMNDFGDVL